MQSRRMSMDLFAQLNLKECCLRSGVKSSPSDPLDANGSFNSTNNSSNSNSNNSNKNDLLVPNYMILSPKPSLKALSESNSTLLSSNELLVNTVTPSTTSSSLSSISKANNNNNNNNIACYHHKISDLDELNRLTMLRREDFYSYPKGLFKNEQQQHQQQQEQQKHRLYENVLLSSEEEEKRKLMMDSVSQMTEEDHIIEYDPELDRFTTTEYARRQIILKSADAESLPLIESFKLTNQNDL